MKKENQKALPLLALLLAAAAILLVFAAPARAGAKAGLALAENTVLPSLLPLLMLFLMIQNTRARVLLSRALTLPAKALRLPPQAAGALLFGQIGGYPTGAVLTGELLDRGVIDRPTARRMLCFNVCGGVGFICTAVGAAALHSGAAGWLLLAANILANLTVAAVTVPLSAVEDGSAEALAAQAGANSVLLDMKTDRGQLGFVSQLAMAASAGVNAGQADINRQLQALNSGEP